MPSLFEEISFEDFYKLYPRHVGKADAAKAWNKLAASDKSLLMSRLPGWLQQYGQDAKYLPYPATWLRARRWEDEIRMVPDVPKSGHAQAEQRQLGVPQVQQYLSGVPDFGDPPTPEERLEGIKILAQCREKLVAHDMRLKLKALAIRRTGKWSNSE